MVDKPGRVYILHFTQAYHHARHYVGATSMTVAERCAIHRSNARGRGARLIRALLQDGGDFVVADVWEADTLREAFAFERKLKGMGGGARSCSICRAAKQQNRG